MKPRGCGRLGSAGLLLSFSFNPSSVLTRLFFLYSRQRESVYHLSASKSSDKIATLYLIVQFIYVLLMSPYLNSASLGGCLINLLANPKLLYYLLEHNTWRCFYFVFLKGTGYTFQCLCLTVRNKMEYIIQVPLWAFLNERYKHIHQVTFWLRCLKLFCTVWTKCQTIISLAFLWFQLQPMELQMSNWDWAPGVYILFLNRMVVFPRHHGWDTRAQPWAPWRFSCSFTTRPLISRTMGSSLKCTYSLVLCFYISKSKWWHLSTVFKRSSEDV